MGKSDNPFYWFNLYDKECHDFLIYNKQFRNDTSQISNRFKELIPIGRNTFEEIQQNILSLESNFKVVKYCEIILAKIENFEKSRVDVSDFLIAELGVNEDDTNNDKSYSMPFYFEIKNLVLGSKKEEVIDDSLIIDEIPIAECLRMYFRRNNGLYTAYEYLLKGDEIMFSNAIENAFSKKSIGFKELRVKIENSILVNDDLFLEKLLNLTRTYFNYDEEFCIMLKESLQTENKGVLFTDKLILSKTNLEEKVFFLTRCRFDSQTGQLTEYVNPQKFAQIILTHIEGFHIGVLKLFDKMELKRVPNSSFIDANIDDDSSLESNSLTSKILIIRLLQDENMFPKADTSIGETYLTYIKLMGFLLSKNEDTIEKAIKRTNKILENKELTTGNKKGRLEHLTKVLPYFISIKHTSIQNKVEKLIESIKGNKV